MKKGSLVEPCGIYSLAVAATLDFLQLEKQKRKEALQNAKPYKKNSIKKITYTDIARIMSAAFGPPDRYMDDIRRYYFNPRESVEIHRLKDSSWAFNAKWFEERCAEYQIDVSGKIDEIQRLYISTLTVGEVLSKSDNSITANIKNQIRQDIHTFCSDFEANYGIQYWKVVLKYFSKYVNYPSVRDLIILLPQCKSDFIDNWIRQLDNVSSPLHRKYRCALEEDRSFLQDYSEELLALNKNQVNRPDRKSCVKEDKHQSREGEQIKD